MRVKVLLFARLRRAAGCSEWEFEAAEPGAGVTARQAADACAGRFALDLRGVMCAVNECYAHPGQLLNDGDELALIPPVSGGAPDASTSISIGEGPLDLISLHARLRQPEYGAQVVFTGSTRSPDGGRVIAALTYEAFEAMAERELAAIAVEARARWPLGVIVIAHRLGRVGPGEVSLFVGAASPHRPPSLEAVPWMVEEVKRRAPVWKREQTANGEAWVEGSSQAAPALDEPPTPLEPQEGLDT